MLHELRIEVVSRGVEIAMHGRLDAHTAPAARAALHHLVDDGDGDLYVNGVDLEIWDSCGLGVLVGAHRRARLAERRLVLSGLPARELRLLRAARLSKVFAVEPSAVTV